MSSGTANRLRTPAACDSAALAVAVIISCVSYTSGLGFYSDDWAFLGRYATAADQSIHGYFTASYSEHHAMRPVQLWLCAGLYWMFGLNPLPYHLFNALLHVINAVLCAAVARRLGVHRRIAVAVALVYVLLPSYSTDRFWFLAFAITLSMTACLASTYADLHAVTAQPRRRIIWKVAAAGALLISGLAYEVPMPVFLIVPLLSAWQVWRNDGRIRRERLLLLVVFTAVNVGILIGLTAFKLNTTVRLGAQTGIVTQVAAIARHAVRPDLPAGDYGLNVFSATRVHFRENGYQLPLSALTLARRASRSVLWLTLAFAIGAFAYLTWALPGEGWPRPREWAGVVLAGSAVFALGYAIFLTNYNVQLTSTGIANRSAIAAALGAAMCLVGTIGWLVTLLSTTRSRAAVFAAIVTTLAASGFLTLNVTAQSWIDAYAAERTVLERIRERFPSLVSHSTLILSGVCPYIGPAIVFESNWDLAGALQVMYGDPTLNADVVKPSLIVQDDAVVTTIYRQQTRYPFGPRAFVYDAAGGSVHPLVDADSARAYFATSRTLSCPIGREGIGVPLF